jgi:ABC-type glucose/galactose transport system permease subunit
MGMADTAKKMRKIVRVSTTTRVRSVVAGVIMEWGVDLVVALAVAMEVDLVGLVEGVMADTEDIVPTELATVSMVVASLGAMVDMVDSEDWTTVNSLILAYLGEGHILT